MGGQRALVPLSRTDVGGGELTGRMKAVIAGTAPDGFIHAHGSSLRALWQRGLMSRGKLSAKGLALRLKLKGLT